MVTPTGWLSGRSVQTDGSALVDEDYTSVNCMFCHRIVHPTAPDVNSYPEDDIYSENSYDLDSTYLATITDHIPETSANGMYVVDDLYKYRRGPFLDAVSNNHTPIYSPFHRQSDLCGTCHDVSNPVYERSGDTYQLNELGVPSPDSDPYTMFPVERTYSEWLNSSFNTSGGVGGTPFGGIKTQVSTCQDCHMARIIASATNNGPDREIGIHDMTGGNTFMPLVTATMPDAQRDEGIARATFMLQNAAALSATAVYTTITVRVTNQTGHKLPSGYPEGRRMWLNVRAFVSGSQIFESGAYDTDTGILTHDDQIKVYEIKPGLSPGAAAATGLSEGPSFHFVLNNTVYKDNRIPPLGFDNANFAYIQSPPVDYSYSDGQNWDETVYTTTQMPDSVVVILYYQTTSKEYIEFLQTENHTNGTGQAMYDMWNQNGKSAPVVMNQVILYSEDISLAVSLINLSVKMVDGHPVLNWQTGSEINNLGFIVMRADEKDLQFREIASYLNDEDLAGLGNSSEGKSYTYVDRDSTLQTGKTYFYKLVDVDFSGQHTEHDPVSLVYQDAMPQDGNGYTPDTFVLEENFPNPFNSGTVIPFHLPKKQTVAIRIYNLQGRLVRTFPEFLYYPGENKLYWDTCDNTGYPVASGVYIYQIVTRDFQDQKKMLLLK